MVPVIQETVAKMHTTLPRAVAHLTDLTFIFQLTSALHLPAVVSSFIFQLLSVVPHVALNAFR